MKEWFNFIILCSITLLMILAKIAIIFGVVYGVCWIVKYMFF